jgi:peptidyl-prolyl cis-trans isomerase SurA
MVQRFAWVLGFVAVLAVAVTAGQQIVVEQVLVKVNGDIVTKSDFEQRTIGALSARPDLLNIPPSSPLFIQAVAEVTPGLILDAVDELLLTQRGRELGYSLGDVQFDEIVNNIQVQNNLEDPEAFRQELLAQGLTLADLRRLLERQMLVTRVQQDDVFARLVVTEEEALAYYEANRDAFTTPITLTLRELLIEVPTPPQGVNVAVDNAAQASADGARERAQAGESFQDLVAELSDAPSAANGGLIGPLSYTDLTPALQAEIDGLLVGEVSQVLRTQRGYQILRLESRTQPRIVTFEEAREDVGNSVAEAKSGAEMQLYLERLRGQATIDWKNEELREAYESALAAQREEFEVPSPAGVVGG